MWYHWSRQSQILILPYPSPGWDVYSRYAWIESYQELFSFFLVTDGKSVEGYTVYLCPFWYHAPKGKVWWVYVLFPYLVSVVLFWFYAPLPALKPVAGSVCYWVFLFYRKLILTPQTACRRFLRLLKDTPWLLVRLFGTMLFSHRNI